jgi:hypothetical protein
MVMMKRMTGVISADEWRTMTVTETDTMADDDPRHVPDRLIQRNDIRAPTEDLLAVAHLLDAGWTAGRLPDIPNALVAHLLVIIASALPMHLIRVDIVLLPDVKNGVTAEDHTPLYPLAPEGDTTTARGKPNSPPCPATQILWKRTELNV